jgi:stage II sporulation protein D
MAPILIPLILFILFNINKQHLENDDFLDLTTVETVRVSLFEASPPSTIRINAIDHKIQFLTENESFDLKPGDGFVFIRATESNLVLNFGSKSIHTDFIEIKNGTGGLTQFFTPESGNRFYHGNFDLKRTSGVNPMIVINSVKLEHYVASVVGSEMNFREMEALKSQAVVARTYALWSIHHSPYQEFHLKDNEQNQVYLGALRSRPDYEEAALATEGEILTWSSKLILSAFSSTCGGITSSNEHVWSGDPLPYLRSTNDGDMCSISPHYTWEFTLNEQKLKDFISERYGYRYQSFTEEFDPGGRVQNVTFINRNMRNLVFNGNEFRLLLNQEFGNMGLKSTQFKSRIEDGLITFYGKGLGHGVGLCQWGAKGFAESGWSYDEILSFYFSGTNIVDLHTIENQKIALSR